MVKIHKKTLEDLEFDQIIDLVSQHCLTGLGKEKVNLIMPIVVRDELYVALRTTNEYLASFENENRIPNHGFEAIDNELQLLKIENSQIETGGFKKILDITMTSNALLAFLQKFKVYYPYLFTFSSNLDISKEIPLEINSVINKFGEVKDDASEVLKSIRFSLNSVRAQVNQSFNAALATYSGLDYLDNIRESVLENKRVLAVTAMYRKKVNGSIMGSSKTGRIVYIQPEATLKHTHDLNNLEFEEKEEVTRLLRELTSRLRPYRIILKSYQDFLTDLDVIHAKAKFAERINGLLPEINDGRILAVRDAYHPLLLINHKEEGLKTYPQSIHLDNNTRILVISGPNAGGKSITLKTMGLLQLMLQSGLLVPVHERSSFCLFNNILSDIGDNQSIENHLSTYSYRLKQMNYFLRKCDENSLFLIDEFGTGSDPELGGALAETFLEVFYEREAFGIITTHYSNLKVLANELPHMKNANMEFNAKSLEPTFKLGLGQPGSSFTFEVAQKNGIPYNLINKAKKKIERGKVRFDATIAKLQKERSKLERTERSLKVNEKKKQTEADKLEEFNERIQKKLESYQELYDSNQRLIYLGQKFNDIASRYFEDKKKRDLLAELYRLVQIENSKRKKLNSVQKRQEKDNELRIRKEAHKTVDKIREKKKATKKLKQLTPQARPILKVGDRVRLEDGRAVGSIDKIEKSKAVVNYGIFTTNVDVSQLELVEAAKK